MDTQGSAVRRSLINALGPAALCLATLGGCGGGEPVGSERVWTPSGSAAAGRGAEATGTRAPRAAAAAAAERDRPALEIVGEVELPRGMVQRAYRVSFRNGPVARRGVVARLVSAGPDVTVVEARVALGDLAAEAVVMADDTITLQHPAGLVIEAKALRWQLTEHGDAAAGGLLRGPPGSSAVAALRDFTRPAPALGTAAVGTTAAAPPGARLTAVLEREATVEQVNAALSRANARIVQMRPGNRTLALEVHAPGSAQALQRVAQRLQDAAAFESVRLPGPDSASGPATAPPDAPDPEPDFNDHRDI